MKYIVIDDGLYKVSNNIEKKIAEAQKISHNEVCRYLNSKEVENNKKFIATIIQIAP